MKLYEKKYDISNNILQKKFLAGIFKIKSTSKFKKFYIFGVQFYKKDQPLNYNNKLTEICNNIFYNTEMMFAVSRLHTQVFPQYKNINLNKTAVLVATGPTLLYYTQNNSYLHFVVNNAFQKINPDYWFAIDGQNISIHYEKLMNSDFIKFYGQCITPHPLHTYRSHNKQTYYHIPDYVIEGSKNAYKFYFDHPKLRVNRDIETQPLPDLGSCVFSALYFAIYSGIKKIYIVGCDCACNGYFNGDKQKKEWGNGSVTIKLLRGWEIFKDYIEIFYPDVELITVNPVGLRGMFKEVYTKSYLEANPELKESLGDNIELLDDETKFI